MFMTINLGVLNIYDFITGYKRSSGVIICDTLLPDELNKFYARFDGLNKDSDLKSAPPPEDQPLSVTKADLRKKACWSG